MKIFIPILFFMLIISCNESGNSSETEDTTSVSDNNNIPEIDHVTGCFMNVTGRDTLVANLVRNGNQVSGQLSFDNYQKDGSTGTVNGILEGEIMKLSYAFSSEGMNSVMDIYFKVNDNSIIRGIGEMNVRGDTAYYVDTTSIRYEGSELTRLDCSKLPAKYQ